MDYYIGIDIGGTGIKAGLVDEDYNIINSLSLPTFSQEGDNDGEKVASGVAKLIKDLCDAQGISLSDIKAAGAGMPGSVDNENGVVVYANNIGMDNTPLRALVYERCGINLQIGNDADVAAFGEYVSGAGKGAKSLLMITLGTGVGGGFIVDGKIYGGANGRGAEFGHMVIKVDGEYCTCGRYGCLEAYASATGIIRMTKKAMEEDSTTKMWAICENDIANVNGKTAFDAMLDGDATGKKVVDEYIHYLASGLASYINVLHPEVICLGGGISHSGDDLLIPLREETYKNVYGTPDEKTTKLMIAKLGNKAGIVGAAMLGRS